MKYFTIIYVATMLALVGIVHADETIRSTDGETRFTIRDRGETTKAIINDKGEKVGYGVRRGDSWAYFVEDDAFTVDEDE